MVINTLHKDLGDPDAAVRAHALRAIGAMRLPAALQIACLAVGRVARDPSALVRCTAALCLPAVAAVGGEAVQEEVEELLSVFLSDSSPSVVGAAAASFSAICPHRLSLLLPRFRFLCHLLADLDACGQTTLLGLLLRCAAYAHGTVGRGSLGGVGRGEGGGGGADGGGEGRAGGGAAAAAAAEGEGVKGARPASSSSASLTRNIPSDVQLLLRCSQGLLHSSSSSAVAAAATVQWELNPSDADVGTLVVPPLLFLLRSTPHAQMPVLTIISSMAHRRPSIFVPYMHLLYPSAADLPPLRAHKLALLPLLATPANTSALLLELQACLRSADSSSACAIIAAVTRVAESVPDVAASVVEGLVQLAIQRGSSGGISSSGGGGGAGGASGGAAGESAEAGTTGEHAGKKQEEECKGGERQERNGQENGQEEGEEERQGNEEKGEEGEEGEEEEGEEELRMELRAMQSGVVLEALHGAKRLIEGCPAAHSKVLLRLLLSLPSIHPPEARALILSLLAHAARSLPPLLLACPTALSLLLPSLPSQPPSVKLQLLNAAAKVYLLIAAPHVNNSPISFATPESSDLQEARTTTSHVLSSALSICASDLSSDVQDRCRFLSTLLSPLLSSPLPGNTKAPAAAAISASPATAAAAAAAAASPKLPADSSEGEASEGSCSQAVTSQAGTQGDSPLVLALACELVLGHELMGSSEDREPITTMSLTAPSDAGSQAATAAAAADSASAGGADSAATTVAVDAASGAGAGSGSGAGLRLASRPREESGGPDRSRFLLSSMSHFVNHIAPGYEPLPERGSFESSPGVDGPAAAAAGGAGGNTAAAGAGAGGASAGGGGREVRDGGDLASWLGEDVDWGKLTDGEGDGGRGVVEASNRVGNEQPTGAEGSRGGGGGDDAAAGVGERAGEGSREGVVGGGGGVYTVGREVGSVNGRAGGAAAVAAAAAAAAGTRQEIEGFEAAYQQFQSKRNVEAWLED
ncbi:unnamed protein product [Closterium sp. NIES-54]